MRSTASQAVSRYYGEGVCVCVCVWGGGGAVSCLHFVGPLSSRTLVSADVSPRSWLPSQDFWPPGGATVRTKGHWHTYRQSIPVPQPFTSCIHYIFSIKTISKQIGDHHNIIMESLLPESRTLRRSHWFCKNIKNTIWSERNVTWTIIIWKTFQNRTKT